MFKRKDTLIILWMTFITVVAWIGLSIYHIWATSTINEIDAASIIPIDPNFDTDTINKLKTREIIKPVYQFNETASGNTSTPSAQTSIISEDGVIPQASEEP